MENLFPVNKSDIFWNHHNLLGVLSHRPLPIRSVIRYNQFLFEVKHHEKVTITYYAKSSKLVITINFQSISSSKEVLEFVKGLGFQEIRSFMLFHMSHCDLDGNCATKTLWYNHFTDITRFPSV